MSSHQLGNRRRSDQNYLLPGIIIFLVLILILIFFSNPLTGFVYNIKARIAHSVWKTTAELPPATTNATISALQADNDQLKQLLGNRPATDESKLAGIIMRPPETPYDMIVVDQGENQGIEVGNVAYGNTYVVLGKVSAVYPNNSVVTLFSSSGQQEEVLIGASSTPGTAKGQGGGNFSISVPRNADVTIGDAVIMSGADPILLGSVEKIDLTPTDSYATIYFKTPINISTLRYVQIRSHFTTATSTPSH